MTLIARIKQAVPCDQFFREHWPDKWRDTGNSICPFHEDDNASLQIDSGFAYCHAENKRWSVIDLCMEYHGLLKGAKEACDLLVEHYHLEHLAPKTKPKIEKIYRYPNEHGVDLFEKVRFTPKNFRHRQPNPKPGERWTVKGIRMVLWQLPELIANQVQPIWLVEGEKDVENTEALGFLATTSPTKGGWNKFVKEWNFHEPLKDREVIICPDYDKIDKKLGYRVGWRYAEDVSRTLIGFAKSVKLILLPDINEGEDVSDFIEKHGREEAKRLLEDLAEKAEPLSAVPNLTGTRPTVEGEPAPKSSNESKFNRLLALFHQTGAEVFLDQHAAGWICIKRDNHFENVRVNSSAFRRYLFRLFVDAFNEPIGRETIEQVGDLLEARAHDTRELHNRFAWNDGKLLVDLGSSTWECVEVSADGYGIVQPKEPPFKRYQHQKPLPEPTDGGSVKEVLDYLPRMDEATEILVIVWLVAAMIENIPRPGLMLHGQQGSGKSTAAEILRSLLDPSSTPTLALSKDAAEFVQMMDHHAIVNLDNLNSIPGWASDAICRAITGSGFSKRMLYTNDDDMIYHFIRTFIANGINIPGTSPDLLDRSILIELRRLEEDNRREKDKLVKGFEAARGRIFGAMLETLSGAMRVKDAINPDRKPRMADWYVWGRAVAEALGFGQEAFSAAYLNNIGSQHEEIINSDLVCTILCQFMDGKILWDGTATELYLQLTETARQVGHEKAKAWPKSAQKLSQRLNVLRHNLDAVGITIDRERGSSRGRPRTLRISNKVPDDPSGVSLRPNANNSKEITSVTNRTDHANQSSFVQKDGQDNCQESFDMDVPDGTDGFSGNVAEGYLEDPEALEDAPF